MEVFDLMARDAGWVVISGEVMMVTVTVAVAESADPAVLLARTQ